MQHLSASSTTTDVGMEQMLDSVAPEDKEHWLSRANAESFGLAWSTPDAECYHLAKWRSLHREAFRKAGLAYPPVFSDRLQTVIKISSLREREAEVLHYHERLWPVESITCHEVFLDLSMSLGRAASCKNERFPCIVPKGRIFKRCAMEWLIVPEAMACQGYDPRTAPALKNYGHRQVFLFSIQYICRMNRFCYHCVSSLVLQFVCYIST